MTKRVCESTVGEQWAIERLVPYENNAKKHTKDKVKKLSQAIKEYGWTSRIQVDSDGVIIAGHGRRLAALELGLKTVPVTVRSDLTPEQIRALRLIDNKVAEGEYDTQKLSEELKELHLDMNFDMSGFFDIRDLDFATDDLGSINLDSLTDDIAGEVEKQSESTSKKIDGEASEEFSLAKVLGFSKVSANQRRLLSRFQAAAEAHTDKEGAEAFCDLLSEVFDAYSQVI